MRETLYSLHRLASMRSPGRSILAPCLPSGWSLRRACRARGSASRRAGHTVREPRVPAERVSGGGLRGGRRCREATARPRGPSLWFRWKRWPVTAGRRRRRLILGAFVRSACGAERERLHHPRDLVDLRLGGPGHVPAVDDQPVPVDVEDPETVSLPGSKRVVPVIARADPAVEVAVLAGGEVDVGRDRGLDVETLVSGDRDRDRVASGPQGLGGQRLGEVGDGRPRVYAVLPGLARILTSRSGPPRRRGRGRPARP